MRLVHENGIKLLLYDSVEDLPMGRFKDYNKALMLHLGIGSDLDSVSSHVNRWKSFTKHGQIESANKELTNMQQNMLYIIAGINLEMTAFAYLIKEVDGKPFSDISDDTIEELTQKLTYKGFTYGKLKQVLYNVKKNWTLSLNPFSVKKE